MTRSLCVALLAALVLTTTATARDAAKENATKTRFYEAVRAELWSEALLAYGQLEERPTPLVFLAARAHYELGHLDETVDALDVVLGEREDHVAALYMLARVRAKQGRADDAKTLLCTSASYGQSVIRDLYNPKDRKIFAALLNDSKFLLRLMTTDGEWMQRAKRDPFASPIRLRRVGDTGGGGGGGGGGGTETELERARQLGLAIEGLFGDFERIAAMASPDFDELRGKLGELRALLDQLADLDLEPVTASLPGLRTKFEILLRTFQPLRLEFYVADGNRHLRAMSASIRGGAFQAAIDRHARLLELCSILAQEEIDVFRRNGEQLEIRGSQLVRRARLEQRAATLPLVVSGVVLAPPPDANSAVINDRIYQEGDSVVDPKTDRLIDDLQILEIKPSTVRFRLSDLEFVRSLKRQK